MVGPEEWVWLVWLVQHHQTVINLVMCLLLVQGPRESDDVCFSFSQHPNIQDMVETWLVLTMIRSIVIFSFVVNCDSYENFICKCLCMNKYIALDKLFMKKCCHYLTLQLQWVPGKSVHNLFGSSKTFKSFCLFQCIWLPFKVTYQWFIANWSH